MIEIRKSQDRGHANFGWLDSHHSFSFGRYMDPRHMGFGPLRVINEDRVAPGAGFEPHAHRDMEILSYVIDGALEHKDSVGNVAVIKPGELQRMSAGSGITHSEYNQSREKGVHFLQIWIMPDTKGIEPGYAQKEFPMRDRQGKLSLLASRDGREGSLVVHQDVALYGSVLSKGESAELTVSEERGLWVQLVKGSITVNGQAMQAGDGAKVHAVKEVTIAAQDESEFLVFDLPI